MKRAAIIVIVCFAAYIAVTRIVPRYGEIISGVGFKAPELQPLPVDRERQPQSQRQAPPLPTPLPPLTNLASTQIVATASVQLVKTNTVQRKSGKPPRQDLIARVALAAVGVDPDAEAYWLMAINDPSLGEHEREDLIEDLNEEGFEDPKRPTVEELPIIINRLMIIEDYAPFAMDEVNAGAFAEAYKDLVNMYVRLTAEAAP